MIYPIKITLHEVLPVLAFGLITVIVVWPPSHGFIGRGRGLLLLVLYAAYVMTVID